MPFISLNQKELAKVLATSNAISPKRSDIEIFTYTYMRISGDQIFISSVNPNIFYSVSLSTSHGNDSDEDVVFLIKTEMLTSAVALISDEQVGFEIDLDKKTLVVQGAKSKHTLRIDTENVADFLLPEEKEDSQYSVTVKAAEFSQAVKMSLVSVGQPKNVYQPEFLNICLTIDPQAKQLLIVSTDRYRITKTVLEAESTSELPAKNYLLLPKTLQLVTSWATDEESLVLDFRQDFLWVKLGKATLTLRYGEGQYPDYNRIIPQSFACSFSLNTKETLDALRQVYLCARVNTTNKSISLKVNPTSSKITFSAQTPDGYSSESAVGISNYEGVQDEWNQTFNADYLIEYINNVSTENVLWEANPGKPSVLSPEGMKEKQMYLVSGLR